jgi:hypothetical protein
MLEVTDNYLGNIDNIYSTLSAQAPPPPGASSNHTQPPWALPAANEALHIIHSACGVHCGLVLCCVSYQALGVCERHIGWCDAVTLWCGSTGSSSRQ